VNLPEEQFVDEPVLDPLVLDGLKQRRDLFAAAALQGLLANPSMLTTDPPPDPRDLAAQAFYLADLMMEH